MWGMSGDTVAVAEPPQPLPEERSRCRCRCCWPWWFKFAWLSLSPPPPPGPPHLPPERVLLLLPEPVLTGGVLDHDGQVWTGIYLEYIIITHKIHHIIKTLAYTFYTSSQILQNIAGSGWLCVIAHHVHRYKMITWNKIRPLRSVWVKEAWGSKLVGSLCVCLSE